jgi:hypothetical protein
LTATHYMTLMVVVCSAYWVFISLVDMLDSKKRLRAKKKTWGKLKEVSEKLKLEKDLEVWKSLGDSNKKNEEVK